MTSRFLERAYQLQAEAAATGFDWPEIEGMLEKLHEELAELRLALGPGQPAGAAHEELGDILFVLVNLARRLGISPETALNAASDKFERRFAYIRRELSRRGRTPEQSSLDEMEALWQEAKNHERAPAPHLPKSR